MNFAAKCSLALLAGITITGITYGKAYAAPNASIGERSVAGITKCIDQYYEKQIEKESIQTLSLEDQYEDNLGIADVDNHLNIRSGAGTNYGIVGKLPKDAGCYIYKIDENGWAKISSGGVKGYVKAEYLITGDKAKEYAKKVGFFAATVTTNTLNVREEPTTDSSILTQIGDSQSFEVLDDDTISKDWVKIQVDDKEGYVSAEYVEIEFMLKKAVSDYGITVGGVGGVSSTRANMIAYGKQFVGNRYVYGGNSLTNGIDCSGFTKALYAYIGYSIPRTAATQANCGRRISFSEIKPGDLVCYYSGGYVSHVAMYIGNNQILHASNPRQGIMISNMWYQTPYCYVRVIND